MVLVNMHLTSGGVKVRVETKRYLLKVRMRTSGSKWSPHQIVCYGLDEIARADRVVSPRQLQKFFPEVKAEELVRPEKIELLISHREGRLAPQRMKRVGEWHVIIENFRPSKYIMEALAGG